MELQIHSHNLGTGNQMLSFLGMDGDGNSNSPPLLDCLYLKIQVKMTFLTNAFIAMKSVIRNSDHIEK